MCVGGGGGEMQGALPGMKGGGREGKAGPLRRGCRGKHANPANFASGPLPQRLYPGQKRGNRNKQPEGRHWASEAGCARTSVSSLAKILALACCVASFCFSDSESNKYIKQFTSVSQLRELSGNTKHPRKYIGLWGREGGFSQTTVNEFFV